MTPVPSNNCIISAISEIELLGFGGLTAEDAARIRERLSEVVIAEVTRDVCNTAIELRREHRLRTPDAVIAATAVIHNAELLTNDAKRFRIAGLRARALETKPFG